MAKNKMPPPTPEDFDWHAAELQQRLVSLLHTPSPQELAYAKWHRGNRTERAWSKLNFLERAEWAQFYYDIETEDLYWEVDEHALDKLQMQMPRDMFCANKNESEYTSPYMKLEKEDMKNKQQLLDEPEDVGQVKTYELEDQEQRDLYVSGHAVHAEMGNGRVGKYKSPYTMKAEIGMGGEYRRTEMPKKRRARRKRNQKTGELETIASANAPEIAKEKPEIPRKRARLDVTRRKAITEEQRRPALRAIAPKQTPMANQPAPAAPAPSTLASGLFYRRSNETSALTPNSLATRALSPKSFTAGCNLMPNPYASLITLPRPEPAIHRYSRELPKIMPYKIYRTSFPAKQDKPGSPAPVGDGKNNES